MPLFWSYKKLVLSKLGKLFIMQKTLQLLKQPEEELEK